MPSPRIPQPFPGVPGRGMGSCGGKSVRKCWAWAGVTGTCLVLGRGGRATPEETGCDHQPHSRLILKASPQPSSPVQVRGRDRQEGTLWGSVEHGGGRPVQRWSSHSSAQPRPSRPCLQTELSEVPWPEYSASRRGQASCAASATLCSRSCLSVQRLPPPRAFLTRMKLMGSL